MQSYNEITEEIRRMTSGMGINTPQQQFLIQPVPEISSDTSSDE
jgi:hypothetical protein